MIGKAVVILSLSLVSFANASPAQSPKGLNLEPEKKNEVPDIPAHARRGHDKNGKPFLKTQPLKPEEALKIFAAVDLNKDGKLDKTEFLKAVKKISEEKK